MPYLHIADEPPEATLVFREQADGRKVARLMGGKVVLLNLADIERVRDGECWRVKLRHREAFAIADPLEKVEGGEPEAATARPLSNPLLPPSLAAAIGAAIPAGRDATPAARVEPESPGSAAKARLDAPAVGIAPAVFQEPAAPAAIAVPARTATAPSPPDPRRIVRAGDRVALFVDGANMDGSCRRAGYFVDYRKARQFFLADGAFNAGYYYVADFTASDPLQQRFFDFLARAGYIVRRRPVKVINDEETGERVIKGNLDTEIVLDMVNTLDNYDIAFLFSGDSDFERAVELLRSRGKRIYIVTASRQLSRELLYVADKPIFLLEDCRAALIRDDRPRPD